MTPTDTTAPGTELEVYNSELPDVQPLSEAKAKALHKRILAARDKITVSFDALWDLLDQAAQGQIHVALGLPSWTAYVKDAVQINVTDKAERKELAVLMSSKGMSQRAIAAALGVSQKTVDRDLEGESFDSDQVTTLDGKTAKRNKPAKEAEPEIIEAEIVEAPNEAEAPRTATDLIEDFRTEVDTLLVNVQAFKDIMRDEPDLFDKARKRLAQRFAGRLKGVVADLDDLINAVSGDDEAAK